MMLLVRMKINQIKGDWGVVGFFLASTELCNIGQTSSTSVAKGEKNALHYVNKNRGLHVHICQIH